MDPLKFNREIEQSNTYVERLQKLIPIEVTALYIFISKIGAETEWEWLLGILLVILAGALWPYLGRLQNVTSNVQKLITIASFLLWISYTDPPLIRRLLEEVFDNRHILGIINPTPLGMIVAVWTFLIPLFAPAKKGDG